MNSLVIATDAPLRFLVQLDLGNQRTGCWLPTGELDARHLANPAASSITTNEVLRPQCLAVGKLNVNAGIVLHESCCASSLIDPYPQLVHPVGQDPLDVGLP